MVCLSHWLFLPKVLKAINKDKALNLNVFDLRLLLLIKLLDNIAYSSYITHSRLLAANHSDQMFNKSVRILLSSGFIERLNNLPVKYRITPEGITFLYLLNDKLKKQRF